MVSKSKDKILTQLKEFVVTVGELEKNESAFHKLKKILKPSKPNPPKPITPTVKSKKLIPQDFNKLKKSVVLWGLEFVVAIFLIFCLLNSSNGQSGFGGTMLITIGSPIAIGLLIFIGIKIKKTQGISSYLAIENKNKEIRLYNEKHKREIKEALQVEENRYDKESEQYNKDLKEYENTIEKYTNEVEIPMKELEDRINELRSIVDLDRDKFGKVVGQRVCREKLYITELNMTALFQYYIRLIEESNECNIDDFETFVEDVSCQLCKLVDEKDDEVEENLKKLLDEILFTHVRISEALEAYNRKQEELNEIQERHAQISKNIREKERKRIEEERAARQENERALRDAKKKEQLEQEAQKRKARDAMTMCYHCKHFDTCTVKGRIDCPAYVLKL